MCFFLAIFFFVFRFVTIFASLFSSQNRSSCLSRSTSTGGRSSSSRYLLLSLPEDYHYYNHHRQSRLRPFLSLVVAFFFFSTPKRFKSRLSFDRKTKAHTLDVSFISLSLSLSLYTLGTKLQAETSRHRGAKGKHHRREERGENAEK